MTLLLFPLTRWFAVLALLVYSAHAAAQLGLPAGDKEGAAKAKAAAPADPLGRGTPQGLVDGFIAAAAAEDYARAAGFLDLSAIAQERRASAGPVLARQLQQLLDRGGWLNPRWQLSGQAEGHLDDGLRPDTEEVGAIRLRKGVYNLLARRTSDASGTTIWRFSPESVAAIPRMLDEVSVSFLNRLLPPALVSSRWAGVPVGHWLALVVLALIAYTLASILARAVWRLAAMVWAGARTERAQRLKTATTIPLHLFLSVWILAALSLLLGVSLVARGYFGRAAEFLSWIMLAWLAWRIIDALSEAAIQRMAQRGRAGAISAAGFFRRIAKVVVAFIAAVALLDNLGFDVTAGIAALGIGGLAIALGAQKTVENLVGSLTLIADQPIRVGDVCKFGEKTGTVLDIGMRSTRIRTLDRTVVTVPNGEFAAIEIENYSQRDKFWFHPVLGLRYETTPDQIRYLLVELRSILYAHPRVDPDPARVRFVGLGADSLNLEVFAYVNAADYGEFLEVQEDLLLRFMDAVEKSGTGFAFPSRTIYFGRDSPPRTDRAEAVAEQVRKWNEAGELQVPRFSPERIAELRGSITYPDGGSAAAR